MDRYDDVEDRDRRSVLRIGKEPGDRQLMGSLSFRRRDGIDDDPLPDPPIDLPEDPPEQVSVPEIALQFNPCLEQLRIDPAGAIAAVEQALEGDQYIDFAQVRYRCNDGTGTLGIWLTPTLDSEGDAARERGLERVDLLEAGEAFAIFITRAYVRRRALQIWNNLPKRLDSDGNFSSRGPVHLTGMSVRFEAPDKIVTRIDGYDERPWPDVDFTRTITDTLDGTNAGVLCETTQDTDASFNWLHILTTLTIALPWHLYLFIDGLTSGSGGSDGGGVGCGIASFMPVEFNIGGGDKLIISYRDVRVTSGGITAAGVAFPTAREPSARIIGDRFKSVKSGATSVTVEFKVNTTDMREPTYNWFADGTVFSRNDATTLVRFNVGDIPPGTSVNRTVTVNVRDADGLQASDSIEVGLFMPREDTQDEPPVCQVRPWLPQCQLD